MCEAARGRAWARLGQHVHLLLRLRLVLVVRDVCARTQSVGSATGVGGGGAHHRACGSVQCPRSFAPAHAPARQTDRWWAFTHRARQAACECRARAQAGGRTLCLASSRILRFCSSRLRSAGVSLVLAVRATRVRQPLRPQHALDSVEEVFFVLDLPGNQLRGGRVRRCAITHVRDTDLQLLGLALGKVAARRSHISAEPRAHRHAAQQRDSAALTPVGT
jgi:hypothetical protein